MIARPCIRCGEPITFGSYCGDCKPDRKPSDHVAWKNNGKWKNLSAKARKLQPWCLDCRATTDLCADHIIPFSVAPELAHSIENLTVRCRSCNGRRGNTFAPDEAQQVVARLHAAYKRHPTCKGRQRIAVAEKALTRGDTPSGPADRSAVRRRGQ